MSAVIRLQPRGRKSRPYYKIVVMDKRKKLTSAYIEQLGTYNPVAHNNENFAIDLEKTKAWVAKGAKPSNTVIRIIKQAEAQLAKADNDTEQQQKTVGKLAKATADKKLAKQLKAKQELAAKAAVEAAAAKKAEEEAAAAAAKEAAAAKKAEEEAAAAAAKEAASDSTSAE